MAQLLFRKVYQDMIRSGRKRMTLRRWDRARVVLGQRVYSRGVGWLIVLGVEAIELSDLSESDAVADGFVSLEDMLETLRSIYPEHASDGKRWWRVRFAMEEAAGAKMKRGAVSAATRPARKSVRGGAASANGRRRRRDASRAGK